MQVHSPVWTALGWTFLHVIWMGAGIGLAASLALRAMRKASPEARHGAALAGLLAMAASPFVGFFAAYEPAPTVPAIAPVAPPRPSPMIVPPAGSFEVSAPAFGFREAPGHRRESSWLESWIAIIPGFWLAGTSLLLARTALGVVGVERLRRSCRPLRSGAVADRCRALARSLGIAREVAVAVCDRVAAPMLIGIVRPMVVLPAAAVSGWTPEMVEMALLHELAHLRHRDNLARLIQKLVEALLFFHPTTWWLSSRLSLERESCRDALVVARSGDRVGYARLLAALADARPPALASLLNERPITMRIRRILFKEDRPMPPRPTAPEALALAAAGLLIAFALIPARAEGPAPRKAGAADLRRLSEIVAAQPSPKIDPEHGGLLENKRLATLTRIAEAQAAAGDRPGALATLDRVELPRLAATKGPRDFAAVIDAAFLASIADARRKIGDIEGARELFGRIVDLYAEPDPERDAKMMRMMERFLVDMARGYDDRGGPGMDVVQAQAVGAEREDPYGDLEKNAAAVELLDEMAKRFAADRELDLLRRLADHASNLLNAVDAPFARAVLEARLGGALVKAGDGPAGRALIAKAKAAVAALPDGVKPGAALLLAEILTPYDTDGAMDIVRSAPSFHRSVALRRCLGTVCGIDLDTRYEAPGLRINIGSPGLAPGTATRADLSKLVAAGDTIEDAKERARTLAILARLQAQAGDPAAAMATAESMPDLRRADHPGPADGFYDAVKPATFALIARHRSKTGDEAGAAAALARSAELTAAVGDDVERVAAGIVLADAYESAGRVDDAKAALAEILPRALAQPEPRRSRLLSLIAGEQADAGDVAGASTTIDAIRDEPGVEKAHALNALARHHRDAGDADAAREVAHRGLASLAPKPSDPKPAPYTPGESMSIDGFADYNADLTYLLLAIRRDMLRDPLREIAGEPDADLAAMQPWAIRRRLFARALDAFRRDGLDAALKVAETADDASRHEVVRSLAERIAGDASRK